MEGVFELLTQSNESNVSLGKLNQNQNQSKEQFEKIFITGKILFKELENIFELWRFYDYRVGYKLSFRITNVESKCVPIRERFGLERFGSEGGNCSLLQNCALVRLVLMSTIFFIENILPLTWSFSGGLNMPNYV